MFELTAFIHTFAIIAPVGLTALGSSYGGGIASKSALLSIDQQPKAKDFIVRTLLIGLALIETSTIIGLLVTFYIMKQTSSIQNIYQAIATLGASLAIALPSMVVAYSSARALRQTTPAIARQPFFARKIINLMILTQSLIQTPVIFGFILSMIILGNVHLVTTSGQAFGFLASGLCLGIGVMGPTYGLGTFAGSVCQSVGKARHAYSKLLTFSLVGGAVIETPNIFALVVSVLIAHLSKTPATGLLASVVFISAGLCTGLGTIGAGVTSGMIAAKTANKIADDIEQYGAYSRMCMLAQGLVDTNALYTLIVSLVILSK